MMKLAGIALCGAILGVTTVSAADDYADEALLEFLGSFDDGEGNWLDPIQLLGYEDVASGNKKHADDEDDDDETGAEEKDDST